MSEQAKCQATTANGKPCRSFALASGYCWTHDPAQAAERQKARSKGGQQSGARRLLRGRQPRLANVLSLIKYTANVIVDCRDGTLDPAVARAVLYGLSIQKSLLELGDIEKRVAALEEQRKASEN